MEPVGCDLVVGVMEAELKALAARAARPTLAIEIAVLRLAVGHGSTAIGRLENGEALMEIALPKASVEERAIAARPFLTPTTIHLATVLFGCAVIVAPSLGSLSFGLIYGLGSTAGLAYSAVIALRVRRRNVDGIDRLWYGLVPLIGYAVIAWAAAMALRQEETSVDVLAVGFILILLAGMRNAWDMIFFLITRERDSH